MEKTMTIKSLLESPPGLLQELLSPSRQAGPDVHWMYGDDACDCVFQQIGDSTNPYIAETQLVRWCCIRAELFKMFPHLVQDVHAYYDQQLHEWHAEAQEWDGEEMDMPRYLWYRQIAHRTGQTLDEVRAEYAGRENERPRASGDRKAVSPPSQGKVDAAQLERLRLSGWL